VTTFAPVKLEPKTKHLAPEQVRYLALEGGGGKGFAYVGAVQVLEKLGVMNRIQGFAGASAGAIVSLLLSVGYTSEKLLKYMAETDFTKFFDSPANRLRPMVGNCTLIDDTDDEKELLEHLANLPEYSALVTALVAVGATGPVGQYLLLQVLSSLFANREVLSKTIKERENKAPFNLLLQHWKKYVAYMGRDMGLFAGCEARKEFEKVLVESMPPLNNLAPPPKITFEQHYRYFRKKLLITGTNLSTGRTQLFSVDETPKFPVADAVRISMSLPFIYKPYIITEKRAGWPECGTYVDGGVWNNLPFREFDGAGAESTEDPPGTSAAAVMPQQKPRTLGLRLEVTPSERIEDFGALLKRVGLYGLFGTGETQVLSKYVDQMVLLDTRGLDLIDFGPPRVERDRAIKRARRATWRYFDLTVPLEDRDDEDDLKTEELHRSTRVCM
jgi:predicted acylesterase/phospholipase RssA